MAAELGKALFKALHVIEHPSAPLQSLGHVRPIVEDRWCGGTSWMRLLAKAAKAADASSDLLPHAHRRLGEPY